VIGISRDHAQSHQRIGVLRSTFLVDEQGHIERVWHNVKADGHAANRHAPKLDDRHQQAMTNTQAGRRTLHAERSEWRTFAAVIDGVLRPSPAPGSS
jgi:hypothetical protein